MKESLWGYWIIILGISIVAFMILLQSYSTTDEQTYFLVKDSLEAAMKEAVDYQFLVEKGGAVSVNVPSCKRGKLKMNTEKFVENFIRRFADTVDISKSYDITFYYISEIPPIASISVTSNTVPSNFGNSHKANDTSAEATSRFTGILFTTEEYANGQSGCQTIESEYNYQY
jgi:hypothetical protein